MKMAGVSMVLNDSIACGIECCWLFKSEKLHGHVVSLVVLLAS